jgi:hypothetical protein
LCPIRHAVRLREVLSIPERLNNAESYLEEAMALKRQHFPQMIYRHRGGDVYSLDNLSANTVWLASPDAHNDPYDCLLRFSARR